MEMSVTLLEKLDARIANERLKPFAGLMNALAASASVGSIIAPIVAGSVASPFWSTLVAGVGGLLHVVGQFTPSDENADAFP